MTHQNHQTNGASLEDCHTNFFALVSNFHVSFDSYFALLYASVYILPFPRKSTNQHFGVVFSFSQHFTFPTSQQQRVETKAEHLSRAGSLGFRAVRELPPLLYIQCEKEEVKRQ